MNRRVITFLVVLGLGILLLVLLFSGGGNKSSVPTKPALYTYANNNTEIQMVIDGPIVDPASHSTVQVSISQSTTKLSVLQGYEGDVISTNSFNNTPNSFKNFLYALYYNGFDLGTASVKGFPSDIGLCSTGDRYDFYLYVNGQSMQHYWLTSCSGDPKTFTGNFSAVQNLIEAQVPGYSELIGNANI